MSVAVITCTWSITRISFRQIMKGFSLQESCGSVRGIVSYSTMDWAEDWAEYIVRANVIRKRLVDCRLV